MAPDYHQATDSVVESGQIHESGRIHDQIAVDRNGGPYGIGASHREIVLKHIANAAGDIPGMYDEMINVISPRSSFNGRAQLIMARYDDVFLDSSFDNGGDGTRFKFDLIFLLVLKRIII